MKKELNPLAAVGVVAAVLLIVGFLVWRATSQPAPPPPLPNGATPQTTPRVRLY